MLEQANSKLENLTGVNEHTALTICSFLANNPLSLIYDPLDDLSEISSEIKIAPFVTKVFYAYNENCPRVHLIEYDIRIEKLFLEYETIKKQ